MELPSGRLLLLLAGTKFVGNKKNIMDTKPVNPRLHGIVDYAFSAILLTLPSALKLNKRAKQTYAATGAVFLGMNAITDTPVAIEPLITLETHQKADAAFLGSLAALTLADFVQNGKRTRWFHLGFFALAVTHYVLTDYKAGPRQ